MIDKCYLQNGLISSNSLINYGGGFVGYASQYIDIKNSSLIASPSQINSITGVNVKHFSKNNSNYGSI